MIDPVEFPQVSQLSPDDLRQAQVENAAEWLKTNPQMSSLPLTETLAHYDAYLIDSDTQS